MVPLEQKIGYLSQISILPKQFSFYQMLSGIPLTSTIDRGREIDDIYYGTLTSIFQNDHEEFKKYYTQIARRTPTYDTPFVNDDFLMYSLIIGAAIFKLDKGWLKKVVSIRTKDSIAVTFDNLLSENYFSSENLSEIVVVYLKKIFPALLNKEFLIKSNLAIGNRLCLFSEKSDFQTICALKAYDIINELTDIGYYNEAVVLKRFENQFLIRTKILSLILYNVTLLIALFGIVKLNSENKIFASWVESYGKVFGILGVGFLSGNFLPSFRNFLHKLVKRSLGYLKEPEK